jgi:hypothetical protein
MKDIRPTKIGSQLTRPQLQEANKSFAGMWWFRNTGSVSDKPGQLAFQHSKLTIQDFESLCPEVNRRSLQRDLKRMVAKGVITGEGATHHQGYRLF